MDGSKPNSISPLELYDAIGKAAAPIVIDVRRSAAFAADNRMIVGPIRRDPDDVQNWRRELPSARAAHRQAMLASAPKSIGSPVLG